MDIPAGFLSVSNAHKSTHWTTLTITPFFLLLFSHLFTKSSLEHQFCQKTTESKNMKCIYFFWTINHWMTWNVLDAVTPTFTGLFLTPSLFRFFSATSLVLSLSLSHTHRWWKHTNCSTTKMNLKLNVHDEQHWRFQMEITFTQPGLMTPARRYCFHEQPASTQKHTKCSVTSDNSESNKKKMIHTHTCIHKTEWC